MKLSPNEEKELIVFIKDWLRVYGYNQKDLANELNISSSRTSEILKRVKELYRRGGIFNIAKKLIEIEQAWLINNTSNPKSADDLDSYSQLDIDYQLDIDELMNQMEKDHQD